MKQFKIRNKVMTIILAISIISLTLFLAITRYSILMEEKNSVESIKVLRDEASATSEEGLKAQANTYLERFVIAQAANSNYIFKTIEAQIRMATDYAETLLNDGCKVTSDNYKQLSDKNKNYNPDTQIIDNKNLDFYYSLAPDISKKNVQSEIEILGKLKTIFKSIVSNNKTLSILPLSVDGVYFGSESGIFYNMTWNAYYNKNYDARKRPWYQAAKLKGELGWSELYVDVATNDYTLTCYSPVYINKKFTGVIGIDVTLNAMLEILSTQVKEIGEAFIIDDAGKVLTYSKLSEELKNSIGEKENIFTSLNNIKKLGDKINSEKTGVYELKVNDVSRIAAYAPIESTSWSVVVLAKTDEIMKYVNKTKSEIDKAGGILTNSSKQSFKNTLGMLAVLFVIIVVIIFFVSNKFASVLVDPIEKLTDGVSKLGQGNLETKIEINTKDELEILANTYNDMTSDLKKYIKDLNDTTAAKQKIESELHIAHNIQASMLPRIFPPFPDRDEIKIFGSMDPAKDVAGDYFDFFFVTEDKFCFTIGDVSGKGVPASLFMVISKVLVKNEALRDITPEKVFTSANNMLCEDNDELLFTTSIIFTIDLKTGYLEYSNAGHNPPLIYRVKTGKYEYIKPKRGFVLGGMPAFEYALENDQLEKGDIVFLYTDGVTEAMDPDNNQYSEERLINKLNSIETKKVDEIEHIITKDIKEFVKDAEQSDDITILIFKYEGKE